MTARDHLNLDEATKRSNYWIDLADYDLAVARTMLKGGHRLYVGFMCHQVAEKSLKGLHLLVQRCSPPYIHALVKLAQLVECYGDLSEENRELLNILEPLNIEARYPDEKRKILQSLTKQRCRELIERTEQFLQWIRGKCDEELRNMPD